MRICLFTATFYPKIGGAELDVDTVARGLSARGHEVGVLGQRTGGPPPEMPYPVRSYRRPPRQNLWPCVLMWPLWRAYRDWRFDAIIAFDGYPCGHVANLFRAQTGVPVVACPQGGDLYDDSHLWRRARVPAIIRRTYREVDRIIAISRWMGDRVRAVSGTDLPPMDVVHNGIDLDAMDAMRDRSRAATADPLIAEPFVLHLARVAPVKQQTLAVRAVHRARAAFERYGMSYAIVGDGKSADEVRTLIDRLGVGHIVKMLGSRRDVEKARLLDRASFFVTTSRQEAFGNVVIEAMAAGLPIVASDVGAHRELIGDEEWGTIFAHDDADDLAAQLSAMLDADRAPMSAAAGRLRERFALSKMIDGYERSCLAALQRRAIGSGALVQVPPLQSPQL